MTHYAIGDIQGCYRELQALLALIGFEHGRDTLWLTGDIVNRGPQSLESLLFAMHHADSVRIVLGNHDLHLLALCYGFGNPKRHDTLAPILQHPNLRRMRDWLRAQPLLVEDQGYLMVHAGILPQWSAEEAKTLAAEVEHALRGHHPRRFFNHMYGNSPDAWSPDLTGYPRLRLITNVFTRMRALHADGSLDFRFKATYGDMPPELHAWFDAPDRRHLSHTVVFGHWSALGYCNDPQKRIAALDTGALWGGCLTALDLDSMQAFHQPSFQTPHRHAPAA